MAMNGKIENIPESKVHAVVTSFESAGWITGKEQHSDGFWTVHLIFPDEDNGLGATQRSGVIAQDQFRAFVADHNTGSVSIAADDLRHDRGVDHP